jgi:hypothetical protein
LFESHIERLSNLPSFITITRTQVPFLTKQGLSTEDIANITPSALFQDQNQVFDLPIDLKQIPKKASTKHKSQDGRGNYFVFNVKVEIRVFSMVDVTVSLCHDGKILANYQTNL